MRSQWFKAIGDRRQFVYMGNVGRMKFFSTRERVIGSVVAIVALGWAVLTIFQIAESNRLDASKSNLLRLSQAYRVYANADYEKNGSNPRGEYPPLSREPGILQMDADMGLQVVEAGGGDAHAFISPGHPESRALSRRAKTDPGSVVTDESYWYLGYALPDEARGMAFVEWYRQQAQRGEIPSPSVIEQGNVLIRRLCEEIDSLLYMDDIKSGKIEPPEGDGTKPPSIVPVMIERPGLFEGGGHVTYADGGTYFLSYPGEYPMTPTFIEALKSLRKLRRASATK